LITASTTDINAMASRFSVHPPIAPHQTRGSHSATSSSSRCVPGSARRSKNASRLKREIEFDRRRPAQIQSTNHRHIYGQLLIRCRSAESFYATWGMFVVTRRVGRGRAYALALPARYGRARRGDGRRSPIGRCQGGQLVRTLQGFRKDGVPVDPGPWWAVNEAQKVRR